MCLPPPSTGPRQCRSCGARFDARTWASMRLLRRIDAAEIAKFLRGWSARDYVEVRSCQACAAQIAFRMTDSAA